MTDRTDEQPAPTPDQPKPASKPAAKSPSAKQPPPPGRRLAALALLLALLTLAAAAAGGYFLWRQLQQVAAQQPEFATGAALREQAERLAAADAELDQRLQATAAGTDANAQRLEQVQQEMSALAQNQDGLQERLAQLDVKAQAQRGEWIRAEAAFLAKIAIARVDLQRDVDGALAALRLADELLSQLGGKAVPQRQAVNRAINRLVAADPPDLVLLAERIDALVAAVDVMPLDQQIDEIALRNRQAAPQEPPPPAATWQDRLRRAWERFQDTLGELVIVQRGKPVEPLIAPEERYFLYHNLRLRLEAARLALIERNQTVYQRSLERAAEWIERYYAEGEPAVADALATLGELRAVNIRPELPQLAPLLEPVTRY